MSRNMTPPQPRSLPVEEESVKISKSDVGRLIGRGGVTVKQMAKESNCKINIMSEKLVVVLSGSKEQIRSAKKLIVDIVGGENCRTMRNINDQTLIYLTRNGWIYQQAELKGVKVEINKRNLMIEPLKDDRKAAEDFEMFVEEQMKTLTETCEEIVRCNVDSMKRINEDATIAGLLTTHNLKLVSKKDDEGPFLSVSGQRGAVDKILESILVLNTSSEGRDILPLIVEFFAGCPVQKFDDLEKDINECVASKYAVKVDFCRFSTQIVITGSKNSVAYAKTELEQLLQFYFPDNCVSIPIPPKAMDTICGKDDQNIVRAQSVELSVVVDRNNNKLWICGKLNPTERAYNRFEELLERWRKLNAQIVLEDSRLVSYLIGPGGTTVKRLMEASGGARITFGDGDSICYISSDTEEVTEAARKVVQDHIQKYYTDKEKGLDGNARTSGNQQYHSRGYRGGGHLGSYTDGGSRGGAQQSGGFKHLGSKAQGASGGNKFPSGGGGRGGQAAGRFGGNFQQQSANGTGYGRSRW